jgi:hypothetical protein
MSEAMMAAVGPRARLQHSLARTKHSARQTTAR